MGYYSSMQHGGPYQSPYSEAGHRKILSADHSFPTKVMFCRERPKAELYQLFGNVFHGQVRHEAWDEVVETVLLIMNLN